MTSHEHSTTESASLEDRTVNMSAHELIALYRGISSAWRATSDELDKAERATFDFRNNNYPAALFPRARDRTLFNAAFFTEILGETHFVTGALDRLQVALPRASREAAARIKGMISARDDYERRERAHKEQVGYEEKRAADGLAFSDYSDLALAIINRPIQSLEDLRLAAVVWDDWAPPSSVFRKDAIERGDAEFDDLAVRAILKGLLGAGMGPFVAQEGGDA